MEDITKYPGSEGREMTRGETGMSKINCKQIAYYGKPIDTLTKEELISALEELAGAIHDCAAKNSRCSDIIKFNTGLDSKDE